MKKKNVYDERQIAEQMKAYRYGFLTATVLMTLFICLLKVFSWKMDVGAAFSICFWIPMTVVELMVIINDAHRYKTWEIFMTHFCGIFGAVSIIGIICRMFRSGVSLQGVSLFIMGVYRISCDAAYLVKKKKDAKFKDEFIEPEDEKNTYA